MSSYKEFRVHLRDGVPVARISPPFPSTFVALAFLFWARYTTCVRRWVGRRGRRGMQSHCLIVSEQLYKGDTGQEEAQIG